MLSNQICVDVKFENLERDLNVIQKQFYHLNFDKYSSNDQPKAIHDLKLKLISLEMRWDSYYHMNKLKCHERSESLQKMINKIRIEFNEFIVSNNHKFELKYTEICLDENEITEKVK